MNVLGINCYLHDSSAALFQEGRLVFAAEEERFSRIKKDNRFPVLAIKAALDHAGLAFGAVDAIAFGWNRGGLTPLHSLRMQATTRLAPSGKLLVGNILSLGRELYYGNGNRHLRRNFRVREDQKVLFVDHHDAHAWSTYALSGFDEALVVVLDGRGASQATTLYHARDSRMQMLWSIPWPNSLGSFYEAFTDLLGFERHNDEWKVMGLAAYGEPTVDLSRVLRVLPDSYRVNSRLVCGRWWNDISALEAEFGPRRDPETLITDQDRDLAASVQKATEDAIFAIVRAGIQATGCRNVCLAGGVAMNSKANGRLLALGLADDVFVQPAATDDGTSVGAALAAHAVMGGEVPRYRLRDVYLGPEYSTSELEALIHTYKLDAVRVFDVENQVAQMLEAGKIVGWFQGRMEFGPRALGSRSILADARRPEMKDRVNESVKFREGWRPFAPSCLEEAASDYFEGCHDAAFMTLTFKVRAEKRSVIPSVTHADDTARVQTVSREANPRYWAVINEFAKLTGVPVIMNTSFNLRGEPIVCSPKDAIRTFYSSGLDFLVLGDFVIAKDRGWKPARVELGADKEVALNSLPAATRPGKLAGQLAGDAAR
jgi:carbamoyltransferase